MNERTITVRNPVFDPQKGIVWEYSLDNVHWQTNPVFEADENGDAFVPGRTYDVFAAAFRGLPDEKVLVAEYTFGSTDGRANLQGLDSVLSVDSVSGRMATFGGLRLNDTTCYEEVDCAAGFIKQPNGTIRLVATSATGGGEQQTPPTVPAGITDQTAIAGQPFSWQFPVFPGAVRYAITAPPMGMIRDEVNRVIKTPDPPAAITTQPGSTIVKLTGIGPTGLSTSVDILITIQPAPVPELFTDIFWSDEGGVLFLYAFGTGEQMRLELLDSADVVVLSERAWSQTGLTKGSLFDGVSDFSYVMIGPVDGEEYTLRAHVEGSPNVIEEQFTYEAGGQGRIYPEPSNIVVGKAITASSGTATHANDDDDATFWLSSNGAQEGLQVDLGKDYVLDELEIIADGLPGANGTGGLWLILAKDGVTLPAMTTGTLTNVINTPGVSATQNLAGINDSWPVDLGNPRPTTRYIRLQQSATGVAVKINELRGSGHVKVNTPPAVLTPIGNVTRQEGQTWNLDIRPNFNDADLDNLTYRAKEVDSAGAEIGNLPSWVTFSGGVFSGTAVFGGAAGTTTDARRIRVWASDGQAETPADFTLTVNKVNVVQSLTKLIFQVEKTGQQAGTALFTVDAGTWDVQVQGVGFTYNPPAPAIKTAATGAFTDDNGGSHNRRAIGFTGLQRGSTYKVIVRQSDNPGNQFSANVTVTDNTTNMTVQLYPATTSDSITNVYYDVTRLSSEKKATLRSDATALVQFRLRTTGGTTVIDWTDGAIPSGKTYYELISNAVLADGGYIAEARLKTNTSAVQNTSFTVGTLVSPSIVRIGIAPNSIVNGICRSVVVYGEVTTGNLEYTWYVYPDDWGTMGTGSYPQGYNRMAGGIGGNELSGIEFETPREFKFRLPNSTQVISVYYSRNGDAVGTIRQVYPARPVDAPAQNRTITAQNDVYDFRVRHAGGKAYVSNIRNYNKAGYNNLLFWENGAITNGFNGTSLNSIPVGTFVGSELEVEIDPEPMMFAWFVTKSTTGADLNLNTNDQGSPYYQWIWFAGRGTQEVYTNLPS
ncbi:hypothetical protein [Larkinella soli]|uniref:hypothetical protein n=1 Tax=Larkinella soli TaxID=1770527 RepID=UPI000FFCA37B|nr:hypothetical protein [Larkinella soli]